jgi:serine/threonine-protein kinase RsbW
VSERLEPGADSREVIKVDLPADQRYVAVVDACLGELLSRHDLGPNAEKIIYGIRLATYEVCTNIVEHAYHGQPGRRIAVDIFPGELPSRLVVELRDTGEPFDAAAVAAAEPGALREGGYGLTLIRSLLDRVDYEATPQGNCWRLLKNL